MKKIMWPKVISVLCVMWLWSGCSDDNTSQNEPPASNKMDMTADLASDMPDLSGDMQFDQGLDQSADMMDMSSLALCAVNQRVITGICQDCPAGTTNDMGDDPNLGMDTVCDPVLCQVNQFVQTNRCQACPMGTSNSAGDDASGPDTSCMNSCPPIFGVTCDAIETSYLKPSTTNVTHRFGRKVAIDGDTLVVGAPGSGGAYVFERQNGQWSQSVRLNASNLDPSERFGDSVAISGDTIVVGSRFGFSAVVFVRQNGQWVEQTLLVASNAKESDRFGAAVAISGDTIVVGAVGEASNATGVNGDQLDNSALSSGAAYVFERRNGRWLQSAYLKASNTEATDLFGYAVAISGNTIVVGAAAERSRAMGVNGDQTDDLDTVRRGAAYVFEHQNGQWSQTTYLKSSNGSVGFGESLAISGDVIVVGTPYEDSNATGVNGDQMDTSAPTSGAVYVFERQNGQWSQLAYLKASNTEAGDWFGQSVAVSGDRIVVGASEESSNATNINGDQMNNSANKSGAAYIFERQNGQWSHAAYLKASNTGGNDRFGSSVAISGKTIVVGAWLEASDAVGVDGDQMNNSAAQSGAAYTFFD